MERQSDIYSGFNDISNWFEISEIQISDFSNLITDTRNWISDIRKSN